MEGQGLVYMETISQNEKKSKEKVTDKLEEIVKHGDKFLPFSRYFGDCRIFKDVYTHWHKEMECIYIRKGRGTFQINKTTIIGHEGDLILIEKEAIHHIRSSRRDVLHFESIVFDLKMMQCVIEDLCQIAFVEPLIKKKVKFNPIVRTQERYYKEISQSFFYILKVYQEKEAYYYVALKAALFQFFYQLLRGGYMEMAQEEETRQIEAMKIVLDYIHTHYSESVTAKEMADMVHYSEYHFMKLFKAYTGKTLISYINEYRIERSKYELLKTNQTIDEIADRVGFCTTSYYIQLFQRIEGLTPKKFRKEQAFQVIDS